MDALLLAGWLLVGGVLPDTVVGLRRGDRVIVENMSGQVAVRSWDRDEISLRSQGDRGGDVSVTRVGSALSVHAGDRKGRERSSSVEIRLPSWVALEIRGRQLDVSVTGMAGMLQVHVVQGDIRAADLSGVITLSTVQGEIEVDGASGKISARSRGDDVVMRRVRGELEASTGDGDVILEEITAARVRAETLDGDLRFQGVLASAGSYQFSVHDGDAEIVVPAGSGVRATVSTFAGEFVSDFPVTLQRYGSGGTFEFVLGDGGASLEIKVFDGEIRLMSGGR